MTQNTMTQNTDPREIHQRAMAQTEIIVAAVGPGQLALATPCTEYDVRALLSHMVGGLTRIAVVGEGGDGLAVVPRADGVPDDGWLAAYRAATARTRAAWADDARLDAMVEVPWGKVSGRQALGGYVQEILTHGWDLAQAIGQPTELHPELATWVLAVAQRILPPERRGGEVPFGPVVQAPPGAGPYTQLAAWLGRQP
ncbi:MAG: TIGR03086 family metal-binding protein [Streptosporangiaceae bacterium]